MTASPAVAAAEGGSVPKPVPLNVYHYEPFVTWLESVQPEAAFAFREERRSAPSGRVMVIEINDYQSAFVQGTCPKLFEAMKWLRAELGGAPQVWLLLW